MYRYILLILAKLLTNVSASVHSKEENSLNPYKNFDQKTDQMKVFRNLQFNENILNSHSATFYKEFAKNNAIFRIDEYYNMRYNLASKLSSKLVYFATNGYNPFRNMMSIIKNPLVIISQSQSLPTFSSYGSEQQTIILKIQEGVTKAEIIDVISSSSQVLVYFCRNNSLLKRGACTETVYETTNKNSQMLIKYKIISGKVGLSVYKIYFLCRINDSFLTVVTYSGQYLIEGALLPFEFKFKEPHFIVRYGHKFQNQLTLANNGKNSIKLSNVEFSGNYAVVNLQTSLIKKKHTVASKGQNKEAKEEGFIEVGPNETKPLLELTLMKPEEANKTLSFPVFSNYTKSTSAVDPPRIFTSSKTQTKKKIRKEKKSRKLKISRESEHFKFIQSYKYLGTGNFIQNSKQPSFPHLESYSMTFTIEAKKYYYHILAFYNVNIRFWDHESLNMGVLCDKKVKHEVTVYVSNRFDKSIILNSVFLQNENADFQIDVVTLYHHKLILPFLNEKFALLRIIISYRGLMDFSNLQATLVANLEVGEQEIFEELPINCSFQQGLFEILNQNDEFVVGKNSLEFSIELKQNSNVDLFLNKLELIGNQNNDDNFLYQNLWENSQSKTRLVLSPIQPVKVLQFKFQTPSHKAKTFKNMFTLSFNVFETFYSTSIIFAYDLKLCAVGYSSREYFDCNQLGPINMGVMSLKTRHKSKTVKIKNNLSKDLHIKSLYPGLDHSDYDVFIKICVQKAGKIVFLQDLTFKTNANGMPVNLNLILKSGEILLFMIELFYSATQNKQELLNESLSSAFVVDFVNSPSISFVLEFFISEKNMLTKSKGVLFSLNNVNEHVIRRISIKSTFPNRPINVTEIEVKGKGKEMVKVTRINHYFSSNLHTIVMTVKIIPALLFKAKQGKVEFVSAAKKLTLFDFKYWKQEKRIWKIFKNKVYFILNAKLVVSNNIGLPVVFNVRGNITRAEFIKSPIVLSTDFQNKLNFNHVFLKNPFNKTVSFNLFIAPTEFLHPQNVLQELKNRLKTVEKKEIGDMTCLEHSAISAESIKHLTRRIVGEDIRFLNHSRSGHSHINEVCFQDISSEQTNRQTIALESLEHYFRITNYDSEEIIANHFIKKIVVLHDIEEYSQFYHCNMNLTLNFTLPKNKFLDFIKSIFHKSEVLSNKNAQIPMKLKSRSDNANFTQLKVFKNLTEYLKEKRVFLNKKYVNLTLKLKPFQQVVLKNALVSYSSSSDSGEKHFQNISLFIKSSKKTLSVIPIAIKQAQFSLSHDHITQNYQNEKSNTIYLTISSQDFKGPNPTIFIPLLKTITFINNGSMPVEIVKIAFKNEKYRENCLQISKLKKRTVIKPNDRLKTKIVVHFCRKSSSVMKTDISVFTTAHVFTFKVEIQFQDFFITLSRENHFKFILFYGQSCIFAFVFIWFSIWVLQIKKGTNQQKVGIHNNNAVFIPKHVLNEKILLYKFKTSNSSTKEKMDSEKGPILISLKVKTAELKQLNEVDPYSPKQTEGVEGTWKFPFDPKLLTAENQTKIQQVENSNVSFEQICKIFDIEKSLSEETENDKTKLLLKAEIPENLDLAENKYGMIGDRNMKALRNLERSNISYNIENQNETSFDRKQPANKTDSVFLEGIVDSFLNQRRIKLETTQSEISDEGNPDLKEDSQSKTDLEKAFGILPLVSSKNKQNKKTADKLERPLKLNDIKQRIQEMNFKYGGNEIPQNFFAPDEEDNSHAHKQLNQSKNQFENKHFTLSSDDKI